MGDAEESVLAVRCDLNWETAWVLPRELLDIRKKLPEMNHIIQHMPIDTLSSPNGLKKPVDACVSFKLWLATLKSLSFIWLLEL